MRIFAGASTPQAQGALVSETLGLFRRDYEILTFARFSGDPLPAAIPVEQLFGFAAGDATWTAETAKSRRLLSALHISFEDLVALLRTGFVGGEVPTGKQTELASRIFLDVDQLKTLREANYAVQPGSDIERALSLGGLTADDVKGYVQQRQDRLSTTIVLDPPIGCSPDELTLCHLDASPISDAGEWLAIHRFVRLAKRMQLSFAELDAALAAVSGVARPDLTPALLAKLAALKDLKETLDLAWPIAASLVADICTRSTDSLYDELFLANGLAVVHPDFRRNADGNVLVADIDVAKGFEAMESAFGAAADTLPAVARALGVTKLNLTGVSAIHRAVVLGGAVGIDAAGANLLREAWAEPNFADPAGLAPASLLEFAGRSRKLLDAGLSAARIAYLRGVKTAEESGAGTSSTGLDKVVADLDQLLAPLRQQDAAERAEEADRATLQQPFSPDDITARTAAGLQRRQTAALAFLASTFALDTKIVSRLVQDQTVDGAAQPALLRADDQPGIVVLSGDLGTDPQKTSAKRLLVGMDRIAVLAGALKLDPSAFSLAAGDAGVLSAATVTALMDNPGAAEVKQSLTDSAVFGGLQKEIGRPAALQTAIRA
jgi:hypothetical protein